MRIDESGVWIGKLKNENENRTPFGVCHGLGGFTHTDPTWIILLGRQFVDRLRRKLIL
jgi:hypothetical protein